MSTRYGSEDFFHQLLSKAIASGASDVHLKVGQPPGVRVSGDIVYFRVDKLTPEDTEAAAKLILGRQGTREFMEELLEYDTSYEVEGLGRFRVNIYRQRSSFAVAMRSVPLKIPTADDLGVSQAVVDLGLQERGMVLVVGAAGNGKSSTLACVVDAINDAYAKHIVTIEDPIEFIHMDKRASISQREVGLDTGNFASALRAALRQDPDVILVGEIRDSETMEIALQSAETGHLVLSTMHTPDVTRSVNRLMALSDSGADIRDRLADCIQGVVAQRLIPKIGGGLVLAQEILVATGTVREAIKRPANNPPLKDLMEQGVMPYGMQTFPMALKALVTQGLVTKEVAKSFL
ncbi:MAG: PilT/PilU family type 4a pilus ATPase [Deltaproteobacteria bacterium]|nr:PilT/PilU family type 4a pilus ATPase [Deltaproteobacteria bacterium]MBW2534990.1 PilT/PilU family type 4a pilus ATPase [Deltaproteobacteria bacterium]